MTLECGPLIGGDACTRNGGAFGLAPHVTA